MTVVIRTKENTTSFFFLSTLQRFHLQCNKVALFPFYCFSAFFSCKKKKESPHSIRRRKNTTATTSATASRITRKYLNQRFLRVQSMLQIWRGLHDSKKKKTVSFPQGRGEGDEQESSAETPLVTQSNACLLKFASCICQLPILNVRFCTKQTKEQSALSVMGALFFLCGSLFLTHALNDTGRHAQICVSTHSLTRKQ